MEEEQAQKQVLQMCNFILNEAKDKAQEIEAKALEDFNIEKLKLVQQMKDKIRHEYKKKANQIEIERSTRRSLAINEARLQKISARQEIIDKVRISTEERLEKIHEDKTEYSNTITALITQALLQMLEPTVYVKCRDVDKSLVEGCLSKAASEYSNILKKAANINKQVKLSIHPTEKLLPPPDKKNPDRPCCRGGVILCTPDETITCDNTLDSRLSIVIQDFAPEIKRNLFPKK